MKRFSAPRARPGQLKAQWGKLKDDNPDICYVWGEGVPKADSHLLHNTISSKRHHPFDNSWSDGFLEELEKRGYDLTTLKFSIEKKLT